MNKKVDNSDFVLNKSKVLQDSKLFNTSNDNDLIKKTLTQVIMLLLEKQFNEAESVLLFYNITKLLNNNNFIVRKLAYLAFKELQVDDVMMVTAILIKDLNTTYKSSAIRLLAKISDVQQIERFVKQIIVDRDSFNSSCALKSCYVKDNRFQNEIMEALNSNSFNQYHAIGLLYLIRMSDRVSVLRMINTFKSRQPHAICMLIRYAWKLMEDEKRFEMLTVAILYFIFWSHSYGTKVIWWSTKLREQFAT
jgi:coatomer protein complex subunit gamma